MAGRLFSRSKTLTLTLNLARPDPSPASSRSFRALFSLPIDPAAAAAAGSSPSRSFLSSTPPPLDYSRRSPLSLGKILGYEQNSQLSAAQGLPRFFCTRAQSGAAVHQADNTQILKNVREAAARIGEPNFSTPKNGDSSKVIAFSPLEGSMSKIRQSGLAQESLKIKRMELSQRITYALIPALILVSKTNMLTSLLVLSVYWQIYGFFKEIILDYVHHEVTQKWVLIYFKLLLLILAKDTIIYFDLV
ncbi:succinate dehydrogenase subunit 4, mitochondrial-like [Ananas comosus]|uniref:Succinate dehydrogenase subunit 4, mitochondrial-like n=1 Tax=Ananas comosus TaxID=4615 RepID=A0A6P5EUZ3_ANACO|nr:succinate dehydrogenase subunit 4, mitochondrial-like [Ananas comosus]